MLYCGLLENSMSNKEDFFRSCIVIDTETNSDNYNIAEIIESGFAVRSQHGEWILYQELHKPKNPIPPKVESICYITNKMVADRKAFADSREEFQEIIDSYKEGYVIAHNFFYDMKVLQNQGINLPEKSICTWRMAKKIFNGTPEIEETNLPYLRFALDLDVPIEMRCHRAGNDSFITAKLLEVFVNMLEEMGVIDQNLPYGPQIVEWVTAPIIYDRMPFGKYKGELMTSIPTSYWQWAMKNTQWFDETADNHDPDLAASIEKALESQ